MIAAGVALLGGLALLVWVLRPVGGAPAGGKVGPPGHPVMTTVNAATRFTGWKVLTLQRVPGADLVSVLYVPPTASANHPLPAHGGTVSLSYEVNAASIQIVETSDPEPGVPISVPASGLGAAESECMRVESISGASYLISRCPDGVNITEVMWKTGGGLEVTLVPQPPGSAVAKGTAEKTLSMDTVRLVIENLH